MVLSHSNSVKFCRCHGLDLGEITWVRHKTSQVKHYRCGYLEKCCVYGNLGCLTDLSFCAVSLYLPWPLDLA